MICFTKKGTENGINCFIGNDRYMGHSDGAPEASGSKKPFFEQCRAKEQPRIRFPEMVYGESSGRDCLKKTCPLIRRTLAA
jgi:hypothetical protein